MQINLKHTKAFFQRWLGLLTLSLTLWVHCQDMFWVLHWFLGDGTVSGLRLVSL
jgi:hypothetical protein